MADHQIGALIDAQAWELLGLTGQEFRRVWYFGGFKGDSRPELTGLLNLMLNGEWNAYPAGPSATTGSSRRNPNTTRRISAL